MPTTRGALECEVSLVSGGVAGSSGFEPAHLMRAADEVNLDPICIQGSNMVSPVTIDSISYS